MTPRQHARSLLEFTRKISNDLLTGIPDDKLTYQPTPTDNHALWVMAHLAGTDFWVISTLGITGAPAVSDAIAKGFGGGSKPAANGNPPIADVRRAFHETRATVLSWLDSAPESALTTNLTEKMGAFASDPIDLMHKLSWHEGWHLGQVANVRKALGLPNILG